MPLVWHLLFWNCLQCIGAKQYCLGIGILCRCSQGLTYDIKLRSVTTGNNNKVLLYTDYVINAYSDAYMDWLLCMCMLGACNEGRTPVVDGQPPLWRIKIDLSNLSKSKQARTYSVDRSLLKPAVWSIVSNWFMGEKTHQENTSNNGERHFGKMSNLKSYKKNLTCHNPFFCEGFFLRTGDFVHTARLP